MTHGPSCVNCEQGRHDLCGMRGCYCHCAGLQRTKSVTEDGVYLEADQRAVNAERRLSELYEAVRAAFAAPHVLELGEDGWSVQHPLACRRSMLTCLIHRHVVAESEELLDALGEGRFLMEAKGNDQFVYTGLPSDYVDPVERIRELAEQ
jgi:hypothetical protein